MRTLAPPWRRVLVGSWIMIAMLSVATLVLYVDNKRTKDCISSYMVADAEATKTRVAVSDLERTAFKKMLYVITDTKSSQAARTQALTDYVSLLDRDDQVREKNPPRSVPTECD